MAIVGELHKDLAGADLHPPGYIQSSDPGAVGTGILWIDTTDSDDLILRVRNAGDNGWDLVGTEGLSFKGAWSAATEYFIGEVVEHNGSAYVANTQHTNSEPPSANWDLLAEKGDTGPTGPAGADGTDGEDGPNFTGAWDSGTTYAIDDLVTHDGTTYIALTAHSNSEPPSANWATFAAKGDGLGSHQTAGITDHGDVNTTGASADDVLTFNGTTWTPVAPAGGGGAGFWEPLAATELVSSATLIDFSSLPTSHRTYLIRARIVVNLNSGISLRLNGDSGGASTYKFQRRSYRTTSTTVSTGTGVISPDVINNPKAGSEAWLEAVVVKRNASERALIRAVGLYENNGTVEATVQKIMAQWDNTADLLNQLSLAGSFAAGTYAQVLGFVASEVA